MLIVDGCTPEVAFKQVSDLRRTLQCSSPRPTLQTGKAPGRPLSGEAAALLIADLLFQSHL